MDYTSCQLVDLCVSQLLYSLTVPHHREIETKAFPATCHLKKFIPVFPEVTLLIWLIVTLGEILGVTHPV